MKLRENSSIILYQRNGAIIKTCNNLIIKSNESERL